VALHFLWGSLTFWAPKTSNICSEFSQAKTTLFKY